MSQKISDKGGKDETHIIMKHGDKELGKFSFPLEFDPNGYETFSNNELKITFGAQAGIKKVGLGMLNLGSFDLYKNTHTNILGNGSDEVKYFGSNGEITVSQGVEVGILGIGKEFTGYIKGDMT